MKNCIVNDCPRPHRARGFCRLHYRRARRSGLPLLPPRSLEDRIRQSVQLSGDCWLWTASLSVGGYGTLTYEGRTQYAHRVSYEVAVGPIPAGLQIDHLCRNRACVNPGHLEPVTPRENCLRGESPLIVAHRMNRCFRGHAFTDLNTRVTSNGTRCCRACRRLRDGVVRPRIPHDGQHLVPLSATGEPA